MEAVHFDQLTRMASTTTRRHCIKLVVSVLVTTLVMRSNASATQLEATVVLSGVCSTAQECRQQDMQEEAICSDNGFTSDGPLTCCVDRGCCSSDADCCGDLRCAPTPDVCYVCLRPPFPTRGVSQACLSTADCIPHPSPDIDIACIQGRCTCQGPENLCSLFGSADIPEVPETDAALTVAEELSRLEVEGNIDRLYDRMHPDAQQIIPREAVIGWYQQELAMREAEVAHALKVRFIPWTWEVTGQTYSGTAEVAYQQRLADGSEARSEVRLVQDWHGNWSWFFGRDRAFVEEQIARFGNPS